MAKIVEVEVMPVAMPADSRWFESGLDETLVVRLTDENGVTGIGDCYASPAVQAVLRDDLHAHVEPQPRWILIGADPWIARRSGTRCTRARFFPVAGVSIHALSAIDIALTDLAGGRWAFRSGACWVAHAGPTDALCHHLSRHGARPQTVRDLMEIIVKQFQDVIDGGFRVVKMEVLFYELCSDTELMSDPRGPRMGADITMAVDFGYRWRSWHDAKWVIDRIADCNIYFAEAPLQHDDLVVMRAWRATAPYALWRRIFRDPLGSSRVDRDGRGPRGPAWHHASRRFHRDAPHRRHGRAALRRRGAARLAYGHHGGRGPPLPGSTTNTPLFEYFPPYLFDSPIREHLVSPEPVVKDGAIALPDRPGLGMSSTRRSWRN